MGICKVNQVAITHTQTRARTHTQTICNSSSGWLHLCQTFREHVGNRALEARLLDIHMRNLVNYIPVKVIKGERILVS